MPVHSYPCFASTIPLSDPGFRLQGRVNSYDLQLKCSSSSPSVVTKNSKSNPIGPQKDVHQVKRPRNKLTVTNDTSGTDGKTLVSSTVHERQPDSSPSDVIPFCALCYATPEHQSIRLAALERQKKNYKWDYTAVGDAAFLLDVPPCEKPSRQWAVAMRRMEKTCISNFSSSFKSVKEFIAAKSTDQPKLIYKKQSPHNSTDSIDPEDFQEYKALFRTIKLPFLAKNNGFLRDDIFGWCRVAGPNPMQLRLVTTHDLHSGGLLSPFVKNGLYQRFSAIQYFDNDAIDVALSESRLFVADYSELSGLCKASIIKASCGKKMYAPIALFSVPRVPEGMSAPPLPVAIMDGETVTFCEQGSREWHVMKMKVQVADAFTHETFYHFGRTHLLMEAFLCATHRTLDPFHPVTGVLMQHFEGTAFINSTSLTDLLHDGGAIDILTAPPMSATRTYAVSSIGAGFSFDREMPDVSLRGRGVDSSALYFPYRDDALALWDAILEFVTTIMTPHYQCDEDVQQDVSLQMWAREVCWAGRVPGFGEAADGSIKTSTYLFRAIAFIIFTASVQHAAVNYPQIPFMQFAPAMPLSVRVNARTSGHERGDNDLISIDDMLPSINDAELQLCMAQMLGSVRYTRLGDYSEKLVHEISGQDGLLALQQLQRCLDGLSKKIEQRSVVEANADLPPYEFLNPQLIPQSINV